LHENRGKETVHKRKKAAKRGRPFHPEGRPIRG
jgi:hypothetical protein